MADSLEDILARLRQNKQTRDIAAALDILASRSVDTARAIQEVADAFDRAGSPASERATVPSIDISALTSRVAALENADHESPLSMHQRLIALEEHKPADIASIDRRLRVLEPCPRARVGQDHSWSGDHGKTCAACGLTRD